MPEASHPDHLIRAGRLQGDDARLFTPEADGPADQAPPDEPGWVVTLATWKAAAATLRARRHPVGVQLPPDARLDELAGPDGELDRTALSFIAIDFPVYTDGRGYSLAQLLRRRYGWDGELRAVGDVMIDTIHYQARVGFDSFLVKPGHDPQRALAAFRTFSVHYQHTYPAPAAA
ncbi:DUF934 domain-containing protein [Bordetella bronchiseptica]|uniref:Oxidoreductase n=1 Tax=Bordetella genomosp. 6 TaxID=463024 RepID=A0ABX4F7D4_9BORD|nr:DUF934 domain-containing protein [Bordetella genomosp. 6]OZI70202.1 hypothetical protein CAL23_21740 [Bordetella genomosp. 6]